MCSAVVGHLDCFLSLAIVTNAAINMVCRCYYYILTYIPSAIYTGVVLLDHMTFLILVFEEPPHCFP
jgi:hypothetical protein